MNWNNLRAVLMLVPAIIEAIKAIEAAIPEGGKGREKLEAIKGILTSVDGAVTALWPALEGVIGVLVGLFNTTGVFRKPQVGSDA